MPASDTQIIETAFEERVKELFKILAEAAYVGEPERDVINRFQRGLASAKRIRDLAIEATKEAGAA